ncbi:hypothetical protein MTO96_016999 [Rhipicephalus appendiculatus]
MARGLLAVVVVIVAAVLKDVSSGDRKQTSSLAAGSTPYGYPDWNQGTQGAAWWLPRLLRQKYLVMLACSGIEFVPRQAWGARPPKEWERLKCGMDIHEIAQRVFAGWEDIAYSFLIGGDGRVYVARGWDAVGAHTKGHNKDALSMAFFGDFSRHLPTPWAIRTLDKLLQCGIALTYTC